MRDLPGPNDLCGEHPSFYYDGPDEDEFVDRCLVCGDFIDYCLGHGEDGENLLESHEFGLHGGCNPLACEFANHEK